MTRFKSVAEDGGVTELVVWRVPQPVPPPGHADRHRPVHAVDGVRVIGFDNERARATTAICMGGGAMQLHHG